MRRIIVSNIVSLDGFFESPDNKLDWFVPDEEFFEYARKMLRSVDTILFGRKTYQHMASYWPFAPADEIADKMNNLPKIVFSRTLQTVDWNNSRLISGDAVEELAKLKQAAGGEMVVLGSALLASSLLQAGLIDEYRVILVPILIGRGYPLFPDIRQRLQLKFKKAEPHSSGIVVLYYEAKN